MDITDRLYGIYTKVRNKIDNEPSIDTYLDTITRDAADIAVDDMWEDLKALAEEIEQKDIYRITYYEQTDDNTFIQKDQEFCGSIRKIKNLKRQWLKTHTKNKYIKQPPFKPPVIEKLQNTEHEKKWISIDT